MFNRTGERLMGLLAIAVVVGGGYAYYYAPDNKATAIMSAIMIVIGFYFGSSKGSRDKDENNGR